jgi:DNA polymerase-3 subunit gamma/tau
MTYQVLARKWRPQSFSSLVGQEAIVTALRNALTEGRIAQAYLFSGIRGVGKTTAARVLAKALNCEKGPAADPCNECTACIEITRGSDLDVIEVDAATYSKVEQVRELTESLKYGPSRDRHKVVVLDEIHRLSRQAFDALLKIVEEPPPHLVFIFATTEIDAVPATVLSRCQEFHFRRVPSLVLSAHLRTICEAEAIMASDTALRLIARAGEGSVRDSVALLDQLATFGSGTIADEDAIRLLGGLDTALFHGLLEAILRGDGAAVVTYVHRIEEEGWDPRHVFSQFLSFCRDALHLGLGGNPEQADLPIEEAQALATVARAAGYENLLRLLHQLLSSEQVVRRSDTGVLALEIAWLRAAELPKLSRVEELLAGTLPAGASTPPSPSSPSSRPSQTARAEQATAPAPQRTERSTAAPADPVPPSPRASAPQPPAPAERSAPRPAAPAAAGATPAGDPVQAFLEAVSLRKPPFAALLSEAEITLVDGELRIAVSPEDPLLDARLQQGVYRQVVEEALAAIATVGGSGLSWRAVRGAPRPKTEAAAPAGGAAADHGRAAENPQVQAILDIFGGRVETVEEHGSFREDQP